MHGKPFMAIDKRHTVSFTGHRSFKMTSNERTLFSTSDSVSDNLRNKLTHTLTELYREGFTTFLCGMAEGFDLLAAEAVLSLRATYPEIRLIAIIPHPGQARRFAPATRLRYEQALAQATETLLLFEHYCPECFHRRNDYLVDHSSVLVAFYNGTPGGTAYTVRRARQQGLRLINLAIQL